MFETIEHIATIVTPFITMGVVPIVALLLKKREKREKETTAAVERYNGYVIWGLLAIGGLANATACAQRDGKCNGETVKAQKEYEAFAKDLQKFKVQQVVKTL